MATIRKRQKKTGIVYDIQVKIRDIGSDKLIVRTTTWQPEEKMTAKQEEKAAAIFADKFEEDVKKMISGGRAATDNPNIIFRDFAAQWLEKIRRDYSVNYFIKGTAALKLVNQFIGGYKIKDLTPAILQNFYDKLDALQKKTVKVLPNPNYRQVLTSYGFSYKALRYEKNVQSCTLALSLQGKAVSRKWADSLCNITKIPFNELFTLSEITEPYAYESIHKIKRIVRTILAHAKKNRLVSDNFASADYIDFPPKPPHQIHCMDDEQAKIFFATVMNYPDIRAKTAMLIFILTGFRKGEVTGLKWSDIDFNKNTITVARSVSHAKDFGTIIKEPKTESSKRTVTIARTLIEQLKEYKIWWDELIYKMGDLIPPDTDWLFIQNNGKVTYGGLFTVWLKKILEEAKLEHCTLHSLRHTNITMQIAAGIPIVTVSARAGHARASTTSDIYAHFIRSSDITAADMIDKMFTDGKKNDKE